MTGPLRRTELAESFRLDLANTLSRYVELLADLFERVLPLAADAEAQADHLLLFRRKRLENVRGLVADIGVDHRVDRRTDPAIFNQVAERRFTVPSDRSF